MTQLSLLSTTLPPMSRNSTRGGSVLNVIYDRPYSDDIADLSLMGGSGGKLKNADENARKELENVVRHKFIEKLFEVPPPQDKQNAMVQKCMGLMKHHIYKESVVLCTSGKPGKCIYFLTEGEAYVMASEKFVDRDEEQLVVKVIHKGDYFGEVSCLYNIPCTATVKTSKWATVYELRGDDLLPMLVGHDVQHITEWFILRCYMPTQQELNQFRVQEGVTTAYLENLPMFRGWEEMPIKTVVRTLPAAPVILYLPDTPIIYENDPGGELTIMINGRADVYDGDTKMCTVFAKTYPFVFGEEGLFNWEYSHRLTVIAQCPCHVIHIPRVCIDRVCIDMAEYSEGADALWRDTNVMWRDVLKSRERQLYKKYNCRLQIEMLYRELRDTEVLMTCEPGLVYMLAINGVASEYDPSHEDIIFDSLADVASTMVYVIDGQLELFQIQDGGSKSILLTYDRGSLFYKQNWMSAKAQLRATMISLLLVLKSDTVKELLKKYPQAHLNLSQGSQFSMSKVQ